MAASNVARNSAPQSSKAARWPGASPVPARSKRQVAWPAALKRRDQRTNCRWAPTRYCGPPTTKSTPTRAVAPAGTSSSHGGVVSASPALRGLPAPALSCMRPSVPVPASSAPSLTGTKVFSHSTSGITNVVSVSVSFGNQKRRAPLATASHSRVITRSVTSRTASSSLANSAESR